MDSYRQTEDRRGPHADGALERASPGSWRFRRRALHALARGWANLGPKTSAPAWLHTFASTHMWHRRPYISVSTAVVLALFSSTDRVRSQQAAEPHQPVEVQMRNVNLHLDQFIILEVRSLRG